MQVCAALKGVKLPNCEGFAIAYLRNYKLDFGSVHISVVYFVRCQYDNGPGVLILMLNGLTVHNLPFAVICCLLFDFVLQLLLM